MVTAAEPSEYEQGVTAGRIDARLQQHDLHLTRINGEMGRVAERLADLVQGNQDLLRAIQRLGDAADADRATAVSLATALEKAEAARRTKSETSWAPMARVITVLVAAAAVAAALIAYASFRK